MAIFAKTNRLLIRVNQRFLHGLSGWGEVEVGALFSGSQSIDACPVVRISYAAILARGDRAERGTGRLMADLRTDVGTEPRMSLRRGVLVLLVLALVQFTSIVDFMVVMPLGPQMIRKLGLTTSQFSLIVASYSISAGLAGLLASSIMDRFGRKSAYLGLFAGFLLGTLACGLTREYHTLLAARALPAPSEEFWAAWG